MDETKNGRETTENNEKKSTVKSFAADLARGCGIGAAFIIPGFSGGSVAAILGIYEKLVGAVAGLLTSFKKSFIFR
jgi:putative membrane protein